MKAWVGKGEPGMLMLKRPEVRQEGDSDGCVEPLGAQIRGHLEF